MLIRGPFLVVLALALQSIYTGPVSAQDSARGEALEESQAATATADTATPQQDEEPSEEWTTAEEGIEERVILAGESETADDFASGDSVAGFDSDDLAALGAVSVADIGQFTPNLEVRTTGSTTPTFFIRGVGLNDFNANSASAIALYFDDVPLSAQALQLPTFFDMEAVNVLRGPQGIGAYRNASAGVIKMYSRRPTGDYGGYLRASFGNFASRDYEGAVEAPIFEDIVAARVAFRFQSRDGFQKNFCGDAIPRSERGLRPNGQRPGTDPEWSLCGEDVPRRSASFDGISPIPVGLPSMVNDTWNWAARTNISFQPTLDQYWLLGVYGSRRDQLSRLGLAYGTTGPHTGPDGSTVVGTLGGRDSGKYISFAVKEMRERARVAAKAPLLAAGMNENAAEALAVDMANIQVMNELASDLDIDPRSGSYNRVGPLKNDTWGTSLRGEISLPEGLLLKTTTGYYGYDRLVDRDLDFSPNVLFEIVAKDEGWQFSQILELSGDFVEVAPVHWEVGGIFLTEDLHVEIENNFNLTAAVLGVGRREYTQETYSVGGYASASWDFWSDFTLDGGVRYNWERKGVDYELRTGQGGPPIFELAEKTWSAPTGVIRLTYRFREDTHVSWKYTRGWKAGHFNATSSIRSGLSSAGPEKNDAFEMNLRGSWFDGRLDLDLSFFHYAYQNYQLFTVQQDFSSQPEFVVINASDVEVYGSEIDLGGRPWEGALVRARMSWLESQFLDFVENQVTQKNFGAGFLVTNNAIDHTGNPLLNSPQLKVSLTGEQTFQMGRWGEFTARYDGVWTDDTFFDASAGRGLPNDEKQLFMPPNTIGQPAFWLHNITAVFRPRNTDIEITGWVRNISDKVYRTFSFDASTFNRTTIHFLGDPRTYGMTVMISF